jgi:hypothetical protein
MPQRGGAFSEYFDRVGLNLLQPTLNHCAQQGWYSLNSHTLLASQSQSALSLRGIKRTARQNTSLHNATMCMTEPHLQLPAGVSLLYQLPASLKVQRPVVQLQLQPHSTAQHSRTAHAKPPTMLTMRPANCGLCARASSASSLINFLSRP